jgi:hypothetical protein
MSKIPQYCELLICDDNDNPAPKFRDKSGTISYLAAQVLTGLVRRLADLEVDLKSLPPSAFKLYSGNRGNFYQCQFSLGLTFGNELNFQMLHNSRVYGTVKASYVQANTADALVDSSRTRN